LYLADCRRLARLMDPRFEGQYNSRQAFQAAQLMLDCLAVEPRSRPSMKEVVETLERVEAMKSRARDTRTPLGSYPRRRPWRFADGPPARLPRRRVSEHAQ
jgi:hypothetical protein